MLIYLHGVSTSGKSTIGSALSKQLTNAIHIDQDTYYKSVKPMVTFEGDKSYVTSNWDTVMAIDFDHFNLVIVKAIEQYSWVIVSGFAMHDELMTLKPDVSFLLDYNINNPMDKISEQRKISKEYSGEKEEKDYWIVRKVLWPYYQETLKKISYDYNIKMFKEDKRRPIQDIVKEMITYLNMY